jgi:hypothetical protein
MGIVIHWNGPAMGNYSKASVPGIVAGTNRFHTLTRGWADIAYNFSVDRFGMAWTGRGDFKWNAASGDTHANSRLLAVECLCGDGDAFTPDMRRGLEAVARAYIATGRKAAVYCHRDIVATECPGNEIIAFARKLNALIQQPGASLQPQRGNTQSTYAEGEEVPEYLIQATDQTCFAVYPSGRCRTLIYPELQYIQTVKPDIIMVRTTNKDNDQIIAHRALLP